MTAITTSKRTERVSQAVSAGLAEWQEMRASAPPLARASGGSRPRFIGEKSPPSSKKRKSQKELSAKLSSDPGSASASNGSGPSSGPENRPRGRMEPLPRRKFLTASLAETTPPMMRDLSFETNRVAAVLRLFGWIGFLSRLGLGLLWDRLRGRGGAEQRALRMRYTLERAGGTFVKVGQYLAMRVDLFSWIYNVELSKLTERAEPLPADEAVDLIEEITGQSLGETFSRFDPEPIGSLAVACIYQAVLRSGKQVIVKLRRPGAGERLMADLSAMRWLLGAMEFFSILRVGEGAALHRDIRDNLLGELDFIQEARQQDLFRRAAKKSGKKFFTAPRVYFDLSCDQLIVEEFVSGMWLWELLEATEQQDARILGLAKELNIDPKKVARRLEWVNFWGWNETVFFNASPHPDSIILASNSRLVFIDFSVTGALDRSKRRAMQQNMYYAWKRDALNMARSSIILLEPLPPVDLPEITQELEAHNLQMLYVLESDPAGATWSERTSALQWLGLAKVARKYSITIETDVLRLLRALLLFDAAAVRLDRQLNIVKEYRKFNDHRASRARDQFVSRFTDTSDQSPADQFILRLDRVVNAGEGLFFRLRHVLSIPTVNFHMVMSTWSFAFSTLIAFVAQVVLVTLVAMIFAGAVALLNERPSMEIGDLFQSVVRNHFYQAILLLLILLSGRKVLIRMDEPETK